MSELRFILGRAGSGKTHTCLTEIVSHLRKAPLGPPLILLVPDQATFQMERALTQSLPSGGFTRARILSFSRLAFAILAEVGGLAKPALSPLGRQMLLRSLLHEYAGDLRVFGRSARQPGFVQQLETALGELARYGHSPQRVARTVDRLSGSMVQEKMADLAVLWQAFRQAIAPDHADPHQYLTAAAEKGPKSTLVKDAEVWVDGFASFTPQEHGVLAMLIQHARACHVALCLDPESWADTCRDVEEVLVDDLRSGLLHLDPLGLFRQTQETCARVLIAARTAGVAVTSPLLLEDTSPPRFQVPELAHIESEFAKPVPVPLSGPVEAVRLVEAVNRRAEVEAAGREIIRLCRDEGYRFREIAVITRDLEPYHDCVAAVFGDLGIPHFIDRRSSIAHHPVVELIRSALAVVVSRWELRPLMRCLKTDLLPLERADVDVLENYAMAHGLRGSAWYDKRPWPYGSRLTSRGVEDERMQRLETVRRQVVGVFQPLMAVFESHVQVRVACEAMYRFLQQAGVPERLEQWAEESVSSGRLQEGMTHQQVWESCVTLLEELVEVLGDTVMASAEFAQVLETGLENLQLGLIPPALDQVLVGAIDRSRQPAIRAAFVLGVGERNFPAIGVEDSMFTDVERQNLEGIGFALGPTAAERALQEQYLGYIAFTRASEYLWVSCPLATEDGRALAPSSFVARLRSALPGLSPEVAGNEPEGTVAESLPWLTSPRRLAAVAVRRLQPGVDLSVARSWRAAASLAESQSEAARVLRSLQHTNTAVRLDPQVAAALVGEPLRFSVSRLESFAVCPFQHFAQYLLGLREREEYRVEYTDIGLLVHESLHRFAQELQARGVDWATLAEDETFALADSLIDEVAPKLRHEVFMSSARYQYLVARMKRVLHMALWVWVKHAQRGRFRPVATEVGFGGGKEAVPGITLELPEGERLILHGRIDRVDACAADSGVYLRVIDYKGSGTGFSVSDLFHGLRLQLTVYLDVVIRAARLGYFELQVNEGSASAAGTQFLPAAAYYFNVREPVVSVTKPLDEEKLEQELLKALRVKGVTLDSPEAICLAEESAQGHLIPARLTQRGVPYSNPLVISRERMQQLFDLAERRIVEFASRILAGEVEASPFRYGSGDSGCGFCRYHVVCQFDPQVAGDHYRLLEYRENRRAWELFDRELGKSCAIDLAEPKEGAVNAAMD